MEVKERYKIKNRIIKKENNSRRKEIILLTIFLIIQTIIYVICGINKSYIHMDEAYSLGLASYDKVEIQDNEDFYNAWHSKEYYEDYLSVQKDELGEYKQVYENQKNDVHPPLYYLILRISMGSAEGYSKWPGIIINIVIYIFITIFMYLILQKLLKNEEKIKEKSLVLAFLSSITMAALTNAIYIRMYALSTLNILITTYLHIKLLETEKINIKLIVFIGISALVGSLTHYYYLFYLAMMFIIFAIKYIKEKDFKKLATYTSTMLLAGILSLIIFPYSIQHMFFGYRGQGVISKLTNIPEFLKSLLAYIHKVNYFGFNNLLYFIIIAIVGIILYNKKHSKTNKENNIETLKIIYLPTIFYFTIVSIASPWIELRYIMPVCGLIFVLVIYWLYQLLRTLLTEDKCNKILAIVLVLIFVSPFIFKIEPEVMFRDKKEIVQKLENELNVPTLYMFNSQNNRFLDDILLFAKLDESYIAKDINCTKRNIEIILREKDISKGVIVFINEGQENDDIIDIIKEATGLKRSEYLKRLNACDVYYLK